MPSSDFIDIDEKLSAADNAAVPQLPPAYEFIDYIGRGGMSVIYKARHRYMNNVVAIKLLQERLAHDKNSYQRFRQEAEASRMLDHLNIIRVDDFGILDRGAPFLVMDYLDGRSLSEVIAQDGALPVARALPLFIQICEGLAHAHKKGVLHRDLKPSNVLVVREDEPVPRERIKIVDFGIAKLMLPEDGAEANRLTSTGEVFGSPLYMSPEQCMGVDVDARSDVYSMGCLMYEALAGKAPLVGTNPLETMFKQMNEVPEPLSGVGQLAKVVARALEKDPQYRYQTVEELLDDLHKVERGVQVRGVRRRMPVWKLAALGVALTVAGLAYFEISHSNDVQLKAKAPKIAAARVWQISANLSDADCARLAGLGVVNLNLRGNPRVTSAGASQFLVSKDIRDCWLDGTSVDDTFVARLTSPPRNKLRNLGLGATGVTAKSMPLLAGVPNVSELLLNDLDLTDADIEAMPNLTSLRTLKLDHNSALTNHAVQILLEKFPHIDFLCMRGTSIDDGAVDMVQSLHRRFRLAVLDTKVTRIFDDGTLRVTDSQPADWATKESAKQQLQTLGKKDPKMLPGQQK